MTTVNYIGNFSQRHCTEVHLAASLEELGCTVRRMQENELEAGWPEHVEADLLLYTRTWGDKVSMRDMARIRERGITSASYHLDLYIGIQRERGLKGDAFWATDYVFTPDGDPHSAEVFKKRGINHFYSPPGVYGPECYEGTPQDRFRCDVLFVGGGEGYHTADWPYRVKLVHWLRDTYGDRYKKFGNPEETIRNEDLNDLYASAKVVVGDTLCKGFRHQRYFSDRITETTGRGGFLIHPYIAGIEELFDVDEMVTYKYDDFDGLKALIDYYVDHEEEREMLRKAAMARTVRDHTYTQRMARMLDVTCG